MVIPICRFDVYPFVIRFVNPFDYDQMVVNLHGACTNNELPDVQAGFGFIYGPNGGGKSRTIYEPLELQGPDGVFYPQTNNRAELRGAIAVMQFHEWHREGFTKLLILTDSQYLVKGATDWIFDCIHNGWPRNDGRPVKNQDLWNLLLKEVTAAYNAGLRVVLGWIPKEQNVVAAQLAKSRGGIMD